MDDYESEIMWRIYLSKAGLSSEIPTCVREFGPRNEKSGIWEASSRSYNKEKRYLIAIDGGSVRLSPYRSWCPSTRWLKLIREILVQQ